MNRSPFKVSAIIPAAGSGSRFGESKQFKLFGHRPLLYHTIRPFVESSWIDEVVISVPMSQKNQIAREVLSLFPSNAIKVVSGGSTRQESVYNGIIASEESTDCVIVHDAARPFVSDFMIEASISKCQEFDGCIIAIPVMDTLKQSDGETIKSTIDRSTIWMAQTPQTFHKNQLVLAFNKANKDGFIGTDESSIMEHAGYKIGIVEGSPENLKITTKADWALATKILTLKEEI